MFRPAIFSQTYCSRNDRNYIQYRPKNLGFNRSSHDKVTLPTDWRCDIEDDESMNMTISEWKRSNLSNSLINYITEDWSPIEDINQENIRARDQARCVSTQTDKASLVSASSQTDDRLFVCTLCRNRQDRYSPIPSTFSRRPNNFGRLLASAQIPRNRSPKMTQKAEIESGKEYPITSYQSPSEHFLCKSLDLSYLNED
ncbi:unnamed protein product [Hymenolepis diminuta]|nr:unnamed protein product [Hymenolepis diminuta]